MSRLKSPLILAVDFDGVVSTNFGFWQGQNVFGTPMRGAQEYLQKLYDEGWIIVIFTVRPESQNLRDVLRSWKIAYDFINKDESEGWWDNPNHKIFANVYLDDRSLDRLHKKWNWKRVYKKIRWKFKSYYERGWVRKERNAYIGDLTTRR